MQAFHSIDEQTWEAFCNGDKEAYAAIYCRFYPALLNYGRKFCDGAEVVEDCAQEVLLQFWMMRHKMQSVQQMPAYLFVSFRNRLFKIIRSARLIRFAAVDTPEFEFELSADQMLINQEHIYEQSISLRNAMQQLTGRQKEALFFRFYENLSYEEIAVVLGISTKALYKLMARALAELRRVYLLHKASSVSHLLLAIIGNTYFF
jgi:RNA polymerase sigma factor (sigma-70 family)